MLVGSAIKWNGKIYFVPKPGRHPDVFALMRKLNPTYSKRTFLKTIQGFVNNDGQFLNRSDAAVYAIKVGQIKKLKWPPLLYSEDLW